MNGHNAATFGTLLTAGAWLAANLPMLNDLARLALTLAGLVVAYYTGRYYKNRSG